jgi:hypothetical protein
MPHSRELYPNYSPLEISVFRDSSSKVTWLARSNFYLIPQGSIYTLSSSEQKLFANYGTYIQHFLSIVSESEYDHVELRFCYDWDDDDPDTGSSGHEEIVIWSDTVGHDSSGNTTQVRIGVNGDINYTNYRTDVYFKLTKSRCVPLGVTVLS